MVLRFNTEEKLLKMPLYSLSENTTLLEKVAIYVSEFSNLSKNCRYNLPTGKDKKRILILVPDLTRFIVLQQEHLTLVAPRLYISNVLQPPHIS